MTYTKNIQPRNHYDDMLLALTPLVICATYMYSARVLLLVVTAFFTARIIDVAVAQVRHHELDFSDKSSIVAAITFSLMLPVSVPLYVVAVTVAMTIFIGKHVFGGKDVYPFSLAALAMCFASVNWPDHVFRAVKPFAHVEFWSGAAASTVSTSSTIKAGGLPYVDMVDLVLGNYAGAIGTSFVLLTAVIGIGLIFTKRISWHVPLSFLVTCTLISRAFPRIYGISRITSVKIEILSSSILFYAVFMLCEPATTPKNSKAKLIFGVVCGIATMIFRYFGAYEVGGCFAILMVNATESFWDRIFEGKAIKEFIDKETVQVKEKITHSEKHITSDNRAHKKPKDHTQTIRSPKTEEIKHTSSKSISAETQNGKKVYRKEDVSQVKTDKKRIPASSKTIKSENDRLTGTSAFSIIAEAEDKIDEVEFSTRSIDIQEILQALEKQSKEGK